MGNRTVNLFRLTAVLALALLFVFAQSAFNWPRRLLGAQVDLLPALMTFTALRMGIPSIVLLAFVGGLSFDALSLNPLGVTPLPLCVVGLVLHARSEQVLRNEVLAQFILGTIASAVTPLATLILILTMGASPLLGAGFVWDWLVLALGGGIATPLLFSLMNRMEAALTYRPILQPSFRPDREIRRGRH